MANTFSIDLSKATSPTGFFTTAGNATTGETTFIKNPTGTSGQDFTSIAGAAAGVLTQAEGITTNGVYTGTSKYITKVKAGTGDDSINVTGAVKEIDAGDGVDVVTVSSGTVKVTLGSGADSLYVTGGTVTLGDTAFEADDYISVTKGSAVLNGKVSLTGGAVKWTDADSLVTAVASTVDGAAIAAGKTISKEGVLALAEGDTYKGVSVLSGSATTDLTSSVTAVTAAEAGEFSASKNATINVGEGDDTVEVTGGVVSVEGAANKDVISVTGGSAVFDGITLSSGAVSLNAQNVAEAQSTGTIIAISSAAQASKIKLATGADTISLVGGVTKEDVYETLGSDSLDTYILSAESQNQTDSNKTSAGTADIKTATIANDSVTFNGETLAVGDNGYYTTSVASGKAGSPDTVYAFAGSYGTDINYTDGKKAYAINSAINGDEGDVVTGGRNKDTIYAGTNDTVNGSRGGDIVKFADDAQNVVLGMTEKEDTVNVTGFADGFGETVGTLSADSTVSDDLDIKSYGGKLVVTGHGTTVKFNDVTLAKGTAAKIKIDTGKKTGADNYEAIYQEGTLDTDASYIYGVSGVTNTLTLDNNSGAGYTLAMSNGHFFDDTRTYANINVVDATKTTGDVALLGTTDTRSTLKGGAGNTTLFGGGKADDLLIAGTGDTNFYYGSGNGRDTIQGYKYTSSTQGVGDTVNLTNGTLISTTRANGKTVMTFEATGDSAADTLTIQDAATTSIQHLRYTYEGAEQVAQIGQSASKNVFTYDEDTTIYFGGSKSDAIQITGGDEVTIALDGSTIGNMKKGVAYTKNINTLNASTATGDVALYGAEGNDTIYGSQGDSTLFGGAGDDVLYGFTSNSAYVTSFYFGTGCGNDTIAASNSDDKVMLYNAASTDFDEANSTASGTGLTLALTDGSTLTIKNYRSGVNRFVFSDGIVKTYDTSSKKWANA